MSDLLQDAWKREDMKHQTSRKTHACECLHQFLCRSLKCSSLLWIFYRIFFFKLLVLAVLGFLETRSPAAQVRLGLLCPLDS